MVCHLVLLSPFRLPCLPSTLPHHELLQLDAHCWRGLLPDCLLSHLTTAMSDPPANPWATSPSLADSPNPWATADGATAASTVATVPTPASSTSTLQSELANLDTILFRFASTPDPKLEPAINRVLPNLLPSLTRPEPDIRNKVIEILNHINKRIKILPQLQLPVTELVMMFVDPLYNASSNNNTSASPAAAASAASSTWFFTFTLLFIDKGMARLDKREQSILAPHLLVHAASHSVQQQKTILNIFLSSLAAMQYAVGEDSMVDKWKFNQNAADRQLLLSFLLDVMLYTSNAATKPATPATHNNNTQPADSPSPPTAAIPEGMSADGVAFVTNDGKSMWTSDEINRHKVNVLAFLSALSHATLPSTAASFADDFSFSSSPAASVPAILDEAEVFPHVLVATSVGDSNVNREADNLLRRLNTHTVLSSPTVVATLYSLFLGSMDQPKVAVAQRRSPASLNLRLKLLGYLNRTSASVAGGLLASALKLMFECWFGAGSHYRLRYSSLFYCSHFLKHIGDKEVTSVGQVLLSALLRLLSSAQPPAAPSPAASSTSVASLLTAAIASPVPSAPTAASMTAQQLSALRGLTYHNLGLLATRCPTLFTRNLKLLSLFFHALSTESSSGDTLQHVHEALVHVRSAFILDAGSGQDRSELKTLLMRWCESDDKRVRVNALVCLDRLYDFADVEARWMCAMCSNDSSIEMRDEATKGLTPFTLTDVKAKEKKKKEEEEEKMKREEEKRVDESTSGKEEVKEQASKSSTTPAASVFSRMDQTVTADVPYPSFPAFIAYVCRQLNLQPSTVDSASSQLTSVTATPIQLDSQVFIHLMDFIAACFADGAKQSAVTSSAYANSLSSSSSASLLSYQHLLELAFLSPLSDVQSTASKHLVALVSSLPAFFAPLYLSRLEWLKRYLLGNSSEGRGHMAQLLSLIAREMEQSSVVSLLDEMSGVLSAASVSAVASSSDAMHGSVLAIGALLAELIRRRVSGPSLVRGCELLVAKLEPATVGKDAGLVAAACVAVGRVGKEGPLPLPLQLEGKKDEAGRDDKKQKAGVPFDRTEVVRRLLSLTRGSDRKQERVTEEAVRSLGLIVQGDQSPLLVELALDGLLKLVTLKHEEVHFAVGETLATIADVSSPADAPTASRPYMPRILSYSMEQLSKGSQVARAASCTWLLCVIKYSKHLPSSSYPALQAVLTLALTDSNQFTQEAAAKALALLYDKSDSADMKDELVNSLLRTFSSGQSKVSADTMVEVDSEKGEFSTMKELMGVANDMGQPDLVYKFLDVASHHSIWQSKMGSAFTLHSLLSTNHALKAKVQSLIPKLYLYQYDQNSKIQDSMRLMWQSLVDNPKQSIDAQYDAIMRHLLRSQASRQFRVRLAACLGLTDLIAHRGWDEVQSYMAELWANEFRLLDDVNGDTRKAAVTLAHTLSQLSIRLCDPKYTSKTDAAACLDVLLPILLKDGITSRAKEIQSVSIRTLLALIKHGGVNLRPHLADLLGTLLEAMSTMESSSLSYLQFHAQHLNMTDEDLEVARLSLAKNTPLADAVASCLQVIDTNALPSVMSRLTDILQQGLGLPTLTATGKCIISLVNSPVGPEMKEHIGPLMSALVNGLGDQSTSVRKVFAAALGYLCRVSRRKRVGRIIESLLAQYTDEASTDSKRLSCGQATQQIVDHATDTTKEQFFPLIAPYAFLASHDTNDDVRKLWSAVWEEMTPSSDSGAVLYQTEILALCYTTFESSSWTIKATTYAALTSLVKATKAEPPPAVDREKLVPMAVKALPGRIWSGKERLFELAVALCVQWKAVMEREQVEALLHVVVEETRRNRTEHKREAIRSVGEIAKEHDWVDVMGEMRDVLSGVFRQATGHESKAEWAEGKPRVIGSDEDAHAKKKAAKADQQYFAVAYQCLGRIFPSASLRDSQRAQLPYTVDSLITALSAGLDWTVRIEALSALLSLIRAARLPDVGKPAVTAIAAACIKQAADGKQSAVRVKALECLLAVLEAAEDEVREVVGTAQLEQYRTLLRERKDDPVAEVLTLADRIRARLSIISSTSSS